MIIVCFYLSTKYDNDIKTNQIRVHKSKHASLAKKELSEEDKIRLQAIDDAITNGFRKAIQVP
jgi:hypothetical protein